MPIYTTCEAREAARRQAEVLVTSAQLFNDPSFDDYDPPGMHFVYRLGHEVEASRTRGRHHAMELAKQDWWDLADLGLDDGEEIRRLFMRPWLEAVTAWATAEPDGLAYRIVEGRVEWESNAVKMHSDDGLSPRS